MTYILITVLGLCLGSFMSVLVFRLDKRGGIVTGRSECSKCGRILSWADLIPLFSFMLLGGRCRYCKATISWIYPILEITTAATLLITYITLRSHNFLEIGLWLAVAFILLAIAFFDYLFFIIPDKLLIPLFVLGLILNLKFHYHDLGHSLLIGLILSGIFGIMYLVSRGAWIGFGDVKFAFIVGLLMGYPIGLFSIVLAVWLAGLVGIVLIIAKRANGKTALPLGTFISLSCLLLLIYQNDIQKFISRYFF